LSTTLSQIKMYEKNVHHIACSKCSKLVCEGQQVSIRKSGWGDKVCIVCYPGKSREELSKISPHTNDGRQAYREFFYKLHGNCQYCNGLLEYFESI